MINLGQFICENVCMKKNGPHLQELHAEYHKK